LPNAVLPGSYNQTGSLTWFAFLKDDKGVVRAKNGCGTKIRSDWLTGTALRAQAINCFHSGVEKCPDAEAALCEDT
jgi:hypothetical protein